MSNLLLDIPNVGSGSYNIRVRLEPVSYLSSPRLAAGFDAVTLAGGHFRGEYDRGLSRFEARAYAPEGIEDSDRDRCLLACFEFHHMVLDCATGSTLHFTGVLVGALAYSRDTYRQLAAGVALTDLEEPRGNWPGDVRYQPRPFEDLQPYLGWRAKVTVTPMRLDDTTSSQEKAAIQ